MKDNRLTDIDRYLDGSLSEKERQSLERALDSDPALKEALQFARLEKGITNTHRTRQRMAQLKEWDQERNKRRQLIRAGLVGLGVILTAAILLVYFAKPASAPDGKQPVIALYEVPADLGTLDEPERGQDQNLTELSSADRYRRAHALYQAGAFEEAKLAFEALQEDVIYGIDAEWFAVLSQYSKLNPGQGVTPLLQAIADNPAHPHRAEAQSLVKLLSSRSSE